MKSTKTNKAVKSVAAVKTPTAKSKKSAPVVAAATVVAVAVATPKAPPSATICRPGTMVDTLYQGLKSGQPTEIKTIFPAMKSQDPGQILTDLRRLGKKLELFSVARISTGVFQLVETK